MHTAKHDNYTANDIEEYSDEYIYLFTIEKVMNILTNTLPNTIPSMKIYLKQNSQLHYTL